MKKNIIWALLFASCLQAGPEAIAYAAGEEVNTSAAEEMVQEGDILSTADEDPEGTADLPGEDLDETDGQEEEAPENVFPEEDEDTAELMAARDAVKAAAPVVLVTEAENVNSVLLGSISYALDATIMQEKAKQPELPAYSEEDLMYLSCIIYCEAGSQGFTGKVAVANVVMNRAESKVFDHVTTIREAIYDCNRWGRQFSPVYVKSNGKWTTKGSTYEKVLTMYKTDKYSRSWERTQMKECIRAAKAALEGKYVLDGDYLYFNMQVTSTKNKCKNSGKPWQVIGSHIFY